MTPILEARGLARSFGSVVAVAQVDMVVHAGEIYGLVGPDGAGKTTTLRMLTGHLGRDAGEVTVLGVDPRTHSERVREAIGYVPQQASLYGDLTVEENLRFFASTFCLRAATYQERKERALAITRLGPFSGRRAQALSGGMYKKLQLACALLHRPKLLVLDEPTNGVDPPSRRELWDLLVELSSNETAVVVATPLMDEATRCHRVGILHEGRLLLEGKPQELLQAFPYEVFRVEGGERSRVTSLLAGAHEQIVLSESGHGLRVVVPKGVAEGLPGLVATVGARLLRVRPHFEDLFLASLRERPSVRGAREHRRQGSRGDEGSGGDGGRAGMKRRER